MLTNYSNIQQQQQQQKRNIEFSLPNPNKRNEVANSGIANGTVEQAGPVTCPKAQKKYIRTVIALEPAIRKTRSGKKKKTKKKKCLWEGQVKKMLNETKFVVTLV